jgi:enolase
MWISGVHDFAGWSAFIQRRMRSAAETFHALKAVLHKKGYNTGVGR